VLSRSAIALYVVGLIAILLALTEGSRVLNASVLVLAATIGDVRVARTATSRRSSRFRTLRNAVRRLVWQAMLLIFVLLDIGGLGFALIDPVWLAPWVTLNMTALVLGTLCWSEYRRLRTESATASERQAERVRATERRIQDEQQCEAQKSPEPQATGEVERASDADPPRSEEEKEGEAQRQQPAEPGDRLRETEQRLRESEELLRQAEEGREAHKQRQAEQAERLSRTEQRLRESEQRLRQAEEEREAHRQRQAEQAERLRQIEQRLREAEHCQRLAEEELDKERQRQRQRQQQKRPGAPSQTDWWSVLGLAPTASKDEIVRNYRRKIQQCHPDRVVGLAPEFVALAEQRTKMLNAAYEHAMLARG
jgi:hypothetical protein